MPNDISDSRGGRFLRKGFGGIDDPSHEHHCRLPEAAMQPDGTIWQCFCGKTYEKLYWIEYGSRPFWSKMNWWKARKIQSKLKKKLDE